MAEIPKQRFGLDGQGWMRLDILAFSLVAAVSIRDMADKQGYKWAKMGVKKNTWDKVDVATLGLAALLAIRGVIDTMEEYDILFKKDSVFPGKGLVATGTSMVTHRFNVF